MVDSAPMRLRTLVAGAVKAASSHNTQPWKFRLEPRRITVVPDLHRRCPIVDPDDHHLFASLGCAVENLVLTAQTEGWRAHTGFDEQTGETSVDFETSPAVTPELARAIDLRQCSRSLYDGSALSAAEAIKLEQAGHGDGVRLLGGSRALLSALCAAGCGHESAHGLHQSARGSRSAAPAARGTLGPWCGGAPGSPRSRRSRTADAPFVPTTSRCGDHLNVSSDFADCFGSRVLPIARRKVRRC